MSKLGLVPTPLFPPMSVSTPIGRSADLDWVCKSLSVRFDGEESEFLADLIVLPMKDFDVLLGMDWLASYHAVIDCFYKTVTIKLPTQEPLVIGISRDNVFCQILLSFSGRW